MWNRRHGQEAPVDVCLDPVSSHPPRFDPLARAGRVGYLREEPLREGMEEWKFGPTTGPTRPVAQQPSGTAPQGGGDETDIRKPKIVI